MTHAVYIRGGSRGPPHGTDGEKTYAKQSRNIIYCHTI